MAVKLKDNGKEVLRAQEDEGGDLRISTYIPGGWEEYLGLMANEASRRLSEKMGCERDGAEPSQVRLTISFRYGRLEPPHRPGLRCYHLPARTVRKIKTEWPSNHTFFPRALRAESSTRRLQHSSRTGSAVAPLAPRRQSWR